MEGIRFRTLCRRKLSSNVEGLHLVSEIYYLTSII